MCSAVVFFLFLVLGIGGASCLCDFTASISVGNYFTHYSFSRSFRPLPSVLQGSPRPAVLPQRSGPWPWPRQAFCVPSPSERSPPLPRAWPFDFCVTALSYWLVGTHVYFLRWFSLNLGSPAPGSWTSSGLWPVRNQTARQVVTEVSERGRLHVYLQLQC